jgi:hypothetical protein
MARRSTKRPEGSTLVTRFDQFQELIEAFVAGFFALLVVVGRPGLSKSQTLRKATRNTRALTVKGRKSPIDFYTDLYWHKDLPVILDDSDDLLGQPLCREYIKALAETDARKRIAYGTKTKILDEEGVPRSFWTSSSVCLISNFWNSSDPIFSAIQSRAEFIYFDPNWAEVYQEAATWFWDQEIFDYVHERLAGLKQPDCRLFVKAYQRKKAGLKTMPWQAVIDDHIDDEVGMVVRKLMVDDSFPNNTARAKAFVEITDCDRATFYRRLAEIRRCQPTSPVKRLLLIRDLPAQLETPCDQDEEVELHATVRQKSRVKPTFRVVP